MRVHFPQPARNGAPSREVPGPASDESQYPGDPGVTLVCAACGKQPTALEAQYTAREGKTHWRRIEHGAGIPGRATANAQARSCGPWVSSELTREQRKERLDEWRRNPR